DRPARGRAQLVLRELDVDEPDGDGLRRRTDVAGQVDGAQRDAVRTGAEADAVPLELPLLALEAAANDDPAVDEQLRVRRLAQAVEGLQLNLPGVELAPPDLLRGGGCLGIAEVWLYTM